MTIITIGLQRLVGASISSDLLGQYTFLILNAVFNCILPPKAPSKVPHQWAGSTYTWSGFKYSHKCLVHSIIAWLSSSAVRFKKYLLCVVLLTLYIILQIYMTGMDLGGGLPPPPPDKILTNFGQFFKDFFQFFQDFVHFFPIFSRFFQFFQVGLPHQKILDPPLAVSSMSDQ